MMRMHDMPPVTAVLFAGGKGTRLHSVTQGRVPKSFVPIDEDSGLRAIDYAFDALRRGGIERIVIATTAQMRAMFEPFEKDDVFIHCDRPDGAGTYDALLDVRKKEGDLSQYLLLAQDNLFHADDIAALRRRHQGGTATWAVGGFVPGMDSYAGIYVDSLSSEIIGDTKSEVPPPFSALSVREYVRSNILMIDPSLLDKPRESFQGRSHKQGEVDVYWDFLPELLRDSLNGMREGRAALLRASVCSFPIVDFGRPERLATAREIYKTTYMPPPTPSSL